MKTKMKKPKQIKKSVYVKNFETKCILGIYPKEKKYPQRVIINVLVEVQNTTHEDSITKVLSYEDIIEIIKNATNKKHRYLAETIAEEIAEKCLQLKNSVKVQVDLAKPDIIEGNTNVGVQIIKRK